MKETIELREAIVSDAEAIASIFHHTIRRVNANDYAPAQIDAWAGPAPEPEKWKLVLADPGDTKIFVAYCGSKVVGYAHFEPSGRIGSLYVHHEHQRRGVASQLLSRIEQEAERQGLSRLFTEASITARPFFESNGFVVVQEQEVEYRGASFKNYKMEKRRHNTGAAPRDLNR